MQEGGPTHIPVPCPACPLGDGPVPAHRLAAADIAPLLCDTTLARRLELAEVLLAMGGVELIECPGCGGRCEPPPLFVLDDSSSVVRCPTSACRRVFCIHCRQPPHAAGVRCRAAEAAASASTARRSAAVKADAAFLDQMDRERNARCPCGSWVQVRCSSRFSSYFSLPAL